MGGYFRTFVLAFAWPFFSRNLVLNSDYTQSKLPSSLGKISKVLDGGEAVFSAPPWSDSIFKIWSDPVQVSKFGRIRFRFSKLVRIWIRSGHQGITKLGVITQYHYFNYSDFYAERKKCEIIR